MKKTSKEEGKRSKPGHSWPSPVYGDIVSSHPVFNVSNYDGISGGSAIGQHAWVSKEGDLKRSVYVCAKDPLANKVMLILYSCCECMYVYMCMYEFATLALSYSP